MTEVEVSEINSSVFNTSFNIAVGYTFHYLRLRCCDPAYRKQFA
jgi:hypothetical protein